MSSGGGSAVVYSTGNSGSSGSVTIDVLDLDNDVITGRFDFVAVSQDDVPKKARISGSFRVNGRPSPA